MKIWAIIGTSNIATEMIQALRRNDQQIKYVMGVDIKETTEFANKWTIPYPISSLEEAVDADVVYIATPNVYHSQYIKQSLELGKDAFAEKPMVLSSKEAIDIFVMADKLGKVAFEAVANIHADIYKNIKPQNLDLSYQQLSSHIKNNTWNIATSFNPKTGGGVVNDLGIYVVSLALHINGPVKKVTLNEVHMFNGVDVIVKANLVHEIGYETNFVISKVNDGNNDVMLDGKVVGNINLIPTFDRLDHEVRDYLKGTNIDHFNKITVQASELLETIGKAITDHKNKKAWNV